MLISIVATVAIALTAAAAPSLRIDMTIAENGGRIVHRPSFHSESGKRAMISSGGEDSELTCALTPTLLKDGTVDIQMVITQRRGTKTDRHAPRIVVPLDKQAKVNVGNLVLTAKPALAK